MMKNTTFVISIIIFGLIILSFSYLVYADDTGFNSPSNDGYVWDLFQAPENAYSQDDTYARSDISDRGFKQDWFEFSISFSCGGCPVIDGILVELDGYASKSGSNWDVYLSWDSGSSWTTPKNTGNLPLSDTDTYIQLGGSSDLWGHSWIYDEFDDNTFLVYFYHVAGTGFNWLDHVRVKVYYTTSQPDEPTCFKTTLSTQYCNKTYIYWTKGIGADKTLVKYSTQDWPTFSTGTQIYNGTGDSYLWTFPYFHNEYYFGLWSWNDTYCRYSNILLGYFISPCSNKITLIENIINATGIHEYLYSSENGFTVWANYTGNETGVSCSKYYYNYSDDNITLNITVNCCNLPENTTNYSINETNWLNLAGSLLFDSGQFSIFISLSLMFFFFHLGYTSRKRSGGAFMLLSGFILIGLEFLITEYINALYVAPLITPYAIFMIFLGIRKWLYPPEREKTKSEGQ